VAALAARTEGSAAGLQPAALPPRGQPDAAGFVAASGAAIATCWTTCQLTIKIEALTDPYLHQVGQLDQFDGIGVICAQDIIAEIGTDMTVFPTAAHLVS
jgi:hypothetical protein